MTGGSTRWTSSRSVWTPEPVELCVPDSGRLSSGVSVTSLFAFSPTDTMPLTRTVTMRMVWESVVSFATLAVVLARAVNIPT